MLRTQITTWQENETALRQIRTEVFLEEQSVPEALEWDADDAEAVHFLVWTEDQQAIATARLIRDRAREARIGRFAVLKPFRHSGIGGRLLGYVLGYARSQGIEQLTLSAQVSVRRLYEQAGFVAEGGVYDEAGIPHIKMRLQTREPEHHIPLTLGQDRTVHRFHDSKHCLDHLRALLQQAQQQVSILSYNLDKNLLDDPEVLSHLSDLARRSKNTQIDVVVGEDKTAVKTSNQFLTLARKLSSSIRLTVLRSGINFPDQVYCLVDGKGVLLRHDHQAWEGFCHYADPGLAARLQEEFHYLKSQSQPSLELRQLGL